MSIVVPTGLLSIRDKAVCALLCGSIWFVAGTAQAQQSGAAAGPQSTIEADKKTAGDKAIAARIKEIYREIPALRQVDVAVQAGVVKLSGTTTDAQAIDRAASIAARVDGVVTLDNAIGRDVSLRSRLRPALGEFRAIVANIIALLPLFALAVAVFFAVVFVGSLLARRTRFWQRITPNAFIAELVTTTLRVTFFVLALVLALNLLGTTALLSAVLGTAGVIGLAVGFAVRDTIENYIASIMLSLRQPFRPKDHVVINTNEGHVIRLTSRATILMTLDGNHLRIPNAEVFKSVILNYTSNPERRFDFELGVDADDDPLDAIKTGVDALCVLPFVLHEPSPLGVIKQVGDSNIVIFYAAWINQNQADFGKSRSLALAAVKQALEDAGFGLPEPIYRLRFDRPLADLPTTPQADDAGPAPGPRPAVRAKTGGRRESLDVTPDRQIDAKVEEQRRGVPDGDLLDEAAPTE